ncbi:MAG: hypothetical protein CL820_00130 [Croceicoccus sp.]|nr:hypothetical protein [Croceicoccus sp.]
MARAKAPGKVWVQVRVRVKEWGSALDSETVLVLVLVLVLVMAPVWVMVTCLKNQARSPRAVCQSQRSPTRFLLHRP